MAQVQYPRPQQNLPDPGNQDQNQDGQPVAQNQGGQPVGQNQGVQPVAQNQGGQPVAQNQGGQPVAQNQGGQTVTQNQGAQPVGQNQGVQPIAQNQNELESITWSWEMNKEFDNTMMSHSKTGISNPIKWLDFCGNPVEVSRDMTAHEKLAEKVNIL
ncbi:endo-1,4-beta-xylanase C-like [Actinia tenebrosa]|uniref:Endo-1,4-beta-xylanase C-like n=1 Tax=Actinia tenebrosa TaxID=6105 RepID=A0A6P8HVH1_ACTTE|nr:endo-1,4-beta-xylanase C-like [Actinia tenebrosa]